METGKRIFLTHDGKDLTVFNQRSRLWTHPYDYVTPYKETLSNAGCGIFSICHCGQWLTGKTFEPDELAEFSMANGGRGDDGTDRPALLSAMMEKGIAQEYGFRYEFDGLRNDKDTLWAHLTRRQGVALCNLRVGHIVSLVDARVADGENQVLVIDSYSETLDDRISPVVREIMPDSAIITPVYNAKNTLLGFRRQYALYWAACDTIRDFNLLYGV